MNPVLYSDRAAVAFSLTCLAHCMLLSALAIMAPFLSVVAQNEWIHAVSAVLAILASTSVIIASQSARNPRFLVPVGLGIGFVILGLFAEHLAISETVTTVIGTLFIAFAHIGRLRKLR
ncbi:MAG: MerC domain-containing protein [Parasphingorhabdus sp.]|uniref:MerC domain-containing protein n=1 Tax=Parasphingorhabdus sp. TaxID=2709688 RepID=UPI003299532E